MEVKISRSSHPMKDGLLLCLKEEEEQGSINISDNSEDWTDAIDRSGLKHISDVLYTVFHYMELVLRSHIRGGSKMTIRGSFLSCMQMCKVFCFHGEHHLCLV